MKAIQISLLVIIALALWMIAFNTLVNTDREPTVQHLEDGKTYQKNGEVTEVTDGNFISRAHDTEPVHFDEYFEYNEDGMLESWGTSTPYNDNLFGRYSLSIDDKDADGNMDQINLSMNSAQEGSPMIMTIYEDMDGDKYPDRFVYLVKERDKPVAMSRDFNLDGIFDYKAVDLKSYIHLESDWQEVDDTNLNFESNEPRAVVELTNTAYTFRDGEWIATASE